MNQSNRQILIVEDDKQIRNFIGYYLDKEEFSYLTSNTGQGALSLLLWEQFDIMLLDLDLPDLDGMEVFY